MELLSIYKDGQRFREKVYSLYMEAFPEIERKPFSLMEKLAAAGRMEILAVAEKGEFLGLVIHMISDTAVILDYFAIDGGRRGAGTGSACLQLLLERFRDRKYILEIEMQDEKADNAEERKRRKAFYLKNGLRETGIFVNVYGTDFELLTPAGKLSYGEYTGVLYSVLGEERVKSLKPRQIPGEK